MQAFLKKRKDIDAKANRPLEERYKRKLLNRKEGRIEGLGIQGSGQGDIYRSQELQGT